MGGPLARIGAKIRLLHKKACHPRESAGRPGKTRLASIAACVLKNWARGGAEIKIQHRDTEGTEVDFARIRAQVLSPCPLCLCGSLSLLRVSASPREPFSGKFELLSRTSPPARKSQLGLSARNPSRYLPRTVLHVRGGKLRPSPRGSSKNQNVNIRPTPHLFPERMLCVPSRTRRWYAKPRCTHLHTTTFRSGNRRGVDRIFTESLWFQFESA